MVIRKQKSRNHDTFMHARTEMLRSATSEKKALHLVEKNRQILKSLNFKLSQADIEDSDPVRTHQNSDILEEFYGTKKTPQ